MQFGLKWDIAGGMRWTEDPVGGELIRFVKVLTYKILVYWGWETAQWVRMLTVQSRIPESEFPKAT